VTSDAMIMPSPALNAAQRYAQGMERKGWVAIDLDSFCKGKPYPLSDQPKWVGIDPFFEINGFCNHKVGIHAIFLLTLGLSRNLGPF